MEKVENQVLKDERALFQSRDLEVSGMVFEVGESPLKESANIKVGNSIFRWKYPLWYCKNVDVKDTILLETARSGIWYTDNIKIADSVIQAPKTFRRCHGVTLENVNIPNADETFWNCDGIQMTNVDVNGDYFGFNSHNIKADNIKLTGNYGFDGAKNIEIRNSTLITKDAFWNCENVVVYDSFIVGEYIGWNSKNVTFINCTIESLQGFCYMDELVMKDCKLINTTLAFEYSSVDAQINSSIDSVMNPKSGKIKAEAIKELILDETKVDVSKTTIEMGD